MRILTVGLGTGHKQVLLGLVRLKSYFSGRRQRLDVVASPAMADRGGKTREYREAMPSWPAIGDLAQCVEALHPSPEIRRILGHRYKNEVLRGNALRHAVVAAFFEVEGPCQKALDDMMVAVNLIGRIVPPTFSSTDLQARLGDRTLLRDQHEINAADIVAHDGVVHVWLHPVPEINPDFVKEAQLADMIIVCPGGMHSQIFLIPGVCEALRSSRALKVCITNLVNARRRVPAKESALDHVKRLEYWLGEMFFDWVVYNTKPFSPEQTEAYEREEKVVLSLSPEDSLPWKCIGAPLLMDGVEDGIEADQISSLRSRARHDPVEIAKAILKILDTKHSAEDVPLYARRV